MAVYQEKIASNLYSRHYMDFKNDDELLERLVSLGLISQDQRRIVAKECEISSQCAEEVLVNLQFVTEKALGDVMAKMKGVSLIPLRNYVLDQKLVREIPRNIAEESLAIPVSSKNGVIELAMADVDDLEAYDRIRSFFPTSTQIVRVLATRSEIIESIQMYFSYDMSVSGLLRELEEGGDGDGEVTVRLVSALLLNAVKEQASDIHFEPESVFVRVRYRINGFLEQICTFHKSIWSLVCVRIKVLGQMNIAESRRPQDGRFSLTILGREIDFRSASHPTIHGENIVIRVLDKVSSLISIEELGYSAKLLSKLRTCLQRPEGLIITTGPTGSGKTTSLYAMLKTLNTQDINVMTLEEPVEYTLPTIRQTNIKECPTFDFAEGVRSILRQDPDVILIGEIRDLETAHMALRASMTGHQVYTTLHTNNALGAIYRFIDFGISTSLLVGNIICILGQRLIRKLCPNCKELKEVSSTEARFLNVIPKTPIYKAKGCQSCRFSGYAGRKALAELLIMDDTLEGYMLNGACHAEMTRYLYAGGFNNFFEEGIAAVINGETDLAEIRRVLGGVDGET